MNQHKKIYIQFKLLYSKYVIRVYLYMKSVNSYVPTYYNIKYIKQF